MIVGLFERRRWLAPLLSGLAASILLAAFVVHLIWIPDIGERAGVDFRQYTSASLQWLNDGTFYHPWQLSGPYEIPREEYRLAALPVLYPPPAVLLFLGFGLVPLLWPLWWLVPIGATALVVYHLRPARWTWPILTLSVLSADTMWLTISGNPVLWTMMALALGIRWKWPAVGVLLKPSLGPFALFGIWTRQWWVALAAAVVISVPFAGMWADYLAAIGNVEGTGLSYSINNIPMMLIPLVAWAGSARRNEPPNVSDAGDTPNVASI